MSQRDFNRQLPTYPPACPHLPSLEEVGVGWLFPSYGSTSWEGIKGTQEVSQSIPTFYRADSPLFFRLWGVHLLRMGSAIKVHTLRLVTLFPWAFCGFIKEYLTQEAVTCFEGLNEITQGRHLAGCLEDSVCVINKWSEEVKSLSRVRLWDPMDCSLPGSSVHGIFQARILEWVAILSPGIFLTQGLNPGLPHCQQTLYGLTPSR